MAESHLKHFTDKGMKLGGVIHVGANDGAEISWYLENDARPVLCFEPHPEAVKRAYRMFANVQGVTYIQCALGDVDSNLHFIVPSDGDDEKTSRYNPIPTAGHDWTFVSPGQTIVVPVLRFDKWIERNKVDMKPYNSLVIDAQGMELEVLKGFGNCLMYFNFLCVELSQDPIYNGEASAALVIEYLEKQGFTQDSPVEAHEDVLFIRTRL